MYDAISSDSGPFRNLLPELWIEYMLPYILQCALSMSTSYATYDMLDGVFFSHGEWVTDFSELDRELKYILISFY